MLQSFIYVMITFIFMGKYMIFFTLMSVSFGIEIFMRCIYFFAHFLYKVNILLFLPKRLIMRKLRFLLKPALGTCCPVNEARCTQQRVRHTFCLLPPLLHIPFPVLLHLLETWRPGRCKSSDAQNHSRKPDVACQDCNSINM